MLTDLFGNESTRFSFTYRIIYTEGVFTEADGRVFFKYKSLGVLVITEVLSVLSCLRLAF